MAGAGFNSALFSGLWAVAGRTGYQLSGGRPHGASETRQHDDRDVPLSALDLRNISAVDIGFEGQLLLREPRGLAGGANIDGDRSDNLCFRHDPLIIPIGSVALPLQLPM